MAVGSADRAVSLHATPRNGLTALDNPSVNLPTSGKISPVDTSLEELAIDFGLNSEASEFHFGEQVHGSSDLALFAERRKLVEVRVNARNPMVVCMFLKLCEMGLSRFLGFNGFPADAAPSTR